MLEMWGVGVYFVGEEEKGKGRQSRRDSGGICIDVKRGEAR